MRTTLRCATVAVLAAAALGGCKGRPIPGDAPTLVTVPTGDPSGGPGGPSARIDVASCTRCHGTAGFAAAGADPLVSAAPPKDAHGLTASPAVGAHRAHLTTGLLSRGLECASCHLVATGSLDQHPAQRQGKVSFSRLATSQLDGSVVTPTWNGATCAGTYCHGNFKNGATANAPAWTGGPVACGSCHGVSATVGPGGTHPTVTGQACSACHGAGYTTSTVSVATHVNGLVEIPAMSCSGCHGDSARVPVASAAANDVDGNPLVKAAPPLDVDAQGASTAVGAHLAHVNQGNAGANHPYSLAVACTACHPVPVSKIHANGTTQVTFGGLATARGATPAPYAAGTATCASTYCHGAFPGGLGANAVSWRAGSLGCTGCHQGPPPTSATSHHPPNPNCATCHAGYTATAVTATLHVNGVADHTPATGCTQCHGDVTADAVAPTDVRAAPASNANAIDAHGNAAAATGQRGVGAHAKHLTGTTWRAQPIACGECHVVPAAGDVAHAASANATVTFGGLAKNRSAPAGWNGATCSSVYCHGAFLYGTNASRTWAPPDAVACGACHGVDPVTGPGGAHPTLEVGQNCGNCHPGYTNALVNKALHINGVTDGGGEPATGGTSCAGCHATIFAGMDGTVAHTSVHGLGSDVPLDGATTWVSPLRSVPEASRSCVNMCHGDHPHDLNGGVTTTSTHEYNVFVDAVSSTTRGANAAVRSTANRAKTDFAATGTGGLCVSCHSRPVAAGRPAITVAGYDASAHDFVQNVVSSGATYTWRYQLHSGAFDRNCTKCHASRAEGNAPTVVAAGSKAVAVHFGDDFSLLAGKRNPAGAAAGFVCYNCHGSAATTPATTAQGNRSGKNIQSLFAKTGSSHPAHADTRHDGPAEFANASFGNQLGVSAGAGQRHASCMDCHDSHGAKAGARTVGTAFAGPALEGAWGAAFVEPLAAGTTPKTANFQKKVIVAGTDLEATLCFKCHSAYYGALPTSPSGAYTETEPAQEFNPATASFHPVLAQVEATRATPNVLAPWTTASRMTCSDCHESDQATDPGGPHGSAAKFILKGPNTLWDANLAVSVIGTARMPNGTFCINCHSQTFTNSRFPAHTNGNHRGTQNGAPVRCWSCHVRIPHGSGHKGLLVSTGTPVDGLKFSDRAPWAVNPRMVILRYPTGTNPWVQNDCACDTNNSH